MNGYLPPNIYYGAKHLDNQGSHKDAAHEMRGVQKYVHDIVAHEIA